MATRLPGLATTELFSARRFQSDARMSIWGEIASPLGLWPLALCVMAAVATPLLLPHLQMLIDLPAHMSRYHVEEAIGRSPHLSRWFVYEWRYLPNLGVDLIVALLTPATGVETATRWVVASIPPLAAFGILLIAKEAHGRIPATALFALPLVYAFPLTFGFANSCFAVSLALIAFGVWLKLLRDDRPILRAAIFVVVSPLVLTMHIIGFGVLALTAGGSLIAREWAGGRSVWRIVRVTAIQMLPVAWPLFILVAWRTGEGATFGGWLAWPLRAQWLLTVLRETNGPLDVGSLVILLAVMVAPLLKPSAFRTAPQILLPALLMWLAVVFLPTRMMGSEFASTRLVPVAMILTLLAIRPRTFSWPVAAFALSLLAVRLIASGAALLAADRTASRELAALDHIARGSRVAAIQYFPCTREWAPPRTMHLASMATVRRDAFVNDQFTAAAGQLMALAPAVDPRLARLSPVSSSEGCERAPVSVRAAGAMVPWGAIDYLWLIRAPADAIAMPAGARRIWSNGASSLYAVSHAVPRATSGSPQTL